MCETVCGPEEPWLVYWSSTRACSSKIKGASWPCARRRHPPAATRLPPAHLLKVALDTVVGLALPTGPRQLLLGVRLLRHPASPAARRSGEGQPRGGLGASRCSLCAASLTIKSAPKIAIRCWQGLQGRQMRGGRQERPKVVAALLSCRRLSPGLAAFCPRSIPTRGSCASVERPPAAPGAAGSELKLLLPASRCCCSGRGDSRSSRTGALRWRDSSSRSRTAASQRRRPPARPAAGPQDSEDWSSPATRDLTWDGASAESSTDEDADLDLFPDEVRPHQRSPGWGLACRLCMQQGKQQPLCQQPAATCSPTHPAGHHLPSPTCLLRLSSSPRLYCHRWAATPSLLWKTCWPWR